MESIPPICVFNMSDPPVTNLVKTVICVLVIVTMLLLGFLVRLAQPILNQMARDLGVRRRRNEHHADQRNPAPEPGDAQLLPRLFPLRPDSDV